VESKNTVSGDFESEKRGLTGGRVDGAYPSDRSSTAFSSAKASKGGEGGITNSAEIVSLLEG